MQHHLLTSVKLRYFDQNNLFLLYSHSFYLRLHHLIQDRVPELISRQSFPYSHPCVIILLLHKSSLFFKSKQISNIWSIFIINNESHAP